MKNLPESEDFVTGISVGIAIHQQKVLTAYERKESLKINGEKYFIQSGDELLQKMIDEICI